MNTKNSLLGRRAAIFATLGAIAAVGIGYTSVARAQEGGQDEPKKASRKDRLNDLLKQAEGRIPGRGGNQGEKGLPKELIPLATAVERKSSFEKPILPPYNLKYCCPPMSTDLLLRLFTDAPRPDWLSPYMLQWGTGPGAAYYNNLMSAYANYFGVLYGGTAQIYTVLYIHAGNEETKCRGPVVGWLWKGFNNNLAGSAGTYQTNTTYYLDAVYFAQVTVGKEKFWVRLQCDSPCVKFSINGGPALKVQNPGFTRSSIDGKVFIESDQKGAIMRDTTRQEMRIDDRQDLNQPEASVSSEGSCKPCAD